MMHNGSGAKSKEALKMAAMKGMERSQIVERVRRLISESRFPLLLTLFIGLSGFSLWLLPNSSEGRRWLAMWQERREVALNQRRFQDALAKDPPLGFPLKETGIAVNPERSRPILVVVLGRCEGCQERVAIEWASTLSQWVTLRKAMKGVLVVQRGTEKLGDAKGVVLIKDESGEIARRLNAFFLPRAYGFVDGKLVWLQRQPDLGLTGTLMDFLEAVKEEERAKAILNAWSAEMREKAWGNLQAVKGERKAERREKQ
jgi:hypothetical protein